MTAAVAVHHRVEGPPDAPVLVLSHSLGCTLAMWEPQAATLARHFQLVRYDLRGHGRSPVPPGPYTIADLGADLLALLDRLEVERAHLCGLSIGGMVSLWVAARQPARVDRLVVCCTSAQLGPATAWQERAALVRAHGTSHVADAVVARWFTPEFAKAHPETVAAMKATIAATPAEGYAGCCAAIEGMDLRPDLGTIRAPTLAIAAAQDPATPPEHLARIAEAMPDCRLAMVEHAAHLVNVERPEPVGDLVLGHLGAGDGTSAGQEAP